MTSTEASYLQVTQAVRALAALIRVRLGGAGLGLAILNDFGVSASRRQSGKGVRRGDYLRCLKTLSLVELPGLPY